MLTNLRKLRSFDEAIKYQQISKCVLKGIPG